MITNLDDMCAKGQKQNQTEAKISEEQGKARLILIISKPIYDEHNNISQHIPKPNSYRE